MRRGWLKDLNLAVFDVELPLSERPILDHGLDGIVDHLAERFLRTTAKRPELREVLQVHFDLWRDGDRHRVRFKGVRGAGQSGLNEVIT